MEKIFMVKLKIKKTFVDEVLARRGLLKPEGIR